MVKQINNSAPSSVTAFEASVSSADPYPTYRAIRLHSPIHYRADRNDWIITRYQDVTALLKDLRLGHPPYDENQDVAPPNGNRLLSLRQDAIRLFDLWLANQNPPDSTRLRKLFYKSFAPDQIAKLNARMKELSNAFIDKAHHEGQMDIIHDLAHPLPFAIICDILGVPEETRPTIERLAQALHNRLERGGTPFARERGLMAISGLTQHFQRLINRWRMYPPIEDNLICTLTRAQAQGYLSEQELLAQCSMMLVAGYITTRHLIGNGMLALLRHPEQLQMLRQRPEIIDTAINELLRYDPPNQIILRKTLEDIEIDGKTIRSGQLVYLVIGAANRDPAVFADPDQLDITRHPNPHLSFGHGIHQCIGASLAKMEAQVAISTLLQRLPRLHLKTQTLQWEDSLVIHGLKSLPVVFN